MRRRIIIIALAALAVGAMLYKINRARNALLGPVYRYPANAGETFLTEDHAVEIARDVMERDGFSESGWKLMEDDRSKAPDGRPDRYLMRGNPERGSLHFLSRDEPPTLQRFVNLELRNGEITAQGVIGK